jgi:phosphoglycerol transferase
MGKKKRNKSGQANGSGAVATEIRQVAIPRTQGYSVTQASKPNFFTGAVFEWLAIAATSLLAFWFLTARIVGVQVSVLADEYLYLLDSHYNGLAEAKYPNYLFQWIYSSTKMCGTEFYSCARGINAFFVIFGAVFIYLLAKYIGKSKLLAGLAAISAILGSYGTYTAYFMPEAIFNGLMMVFFWAIMRFGKTDNLLVWAAIGSSLGIASLAKPHGLFVVPAVVIFVVLWTRATKDKWMVAAALRSVVFVGSVVGSKFLFGYLLAGEGALSLFGLYGTLESISQGAADKVTSSVTNDSGVSVFFTGWGQTLMMTMIIGLALAVAIHGLILGFKKESELFDQIKFRVLMGIALLNMMGAIAMFEALINFDVWMHTRYYTYLIPLAILVLIEALVRQEHKVWPWAKYSVVAVFLGLSFYNLATNAAPYSSNWIDAPDFRALIDNLPLAQLSIIVGVIASIVWLAKAKAAVVISLVLAVFFAVFSGAHNSNFLKNTFDGETAYEHVARVLRDFIPQEELDRAVLIGQNEMLQRTVFSSLTGSASILGSPEGSLDRSEIDSSKSWLIAIGEPVLTGFEKPTISGLGYNMYSLNSSNSLAPRNSRVTNFTNTCSGQSKIDWACGSETTITFDEPFPSNANVDLIFELAESAAGDDIELVLGEAVISGRLVAGLNSVNVKFSNASPVASLVVRSLAKPAASGSEAQPLIRPIWGLSRSGQ